MVDRIGGMRASFSADDVGAPGKKPGRISANALAKFESDLLSGGSAEAIPRATLSPRHTSSSEMGSTSASQEHIHPFRPHSVQICEPDEDMEADGKEKESGDKNEKKRKSIWKWKPLKRVRKFFSRKKRTKSCEDLHTSAYRSKESNENLTIDKQHGKSSPVVRTRTMPASNKSPKDIRRRGQASSHEEVRDDSPGFSSKTLSLPTLNAGASLLKEYADTQEAGISFENDPNSSSLEGLQAARDKIKAAPKRRRPPSRNRAGSATSTKSAESPARKEQRTTHRRSKTDPKELSRDFDISFESSSQSDILNNTIFEGAEEETEQTMKSSTTAQKDNTTDKDKAVIKDDIMSRVENAMARTSGSPKLAIREEVKKSENSAIESSTAFLTKLEKEETKKESVYEKKKEPKRYSLDEKTRKSFTESVITSKSEPDILKAEESGFLYSEPPVYLWENTKTSDRTITPKQQAEESTKRENESEETELTGKASNPNTPFKRGKSWSNNYKPKWKEFPIKQNNEEEMTDLKKSLKPVGDSPQQESEVRSSFEDKKDFRFSRTKSWSYGMKAGETAKSNQDPKLGENKEETKDGPTWIAKANRMSQRISELLEDPNSSDPNQTPTLRKSKKESADKTQTSPKPVAKDPIKSKPLETVTKELKPSPNPSKPSDESKLSPASKPTPASKPSIASKPSPVLRPKPSSFVRNSGSLTRITGSGSSDVKPTSSLAASSTDSNQKNSIKKLNTSTTESKKTVQEMARSSFGNVKIEKCIVCGTTVYQMEKCKFDDSVLHRNCIKCSVCKRHLTVGNFVLAESKIYCKPHSQTVAVST